jgi:hypothetical protein
MHHAEDVAANLNGRFFQFLNTELIHSALDYFPTKEIKSGDYAPAFRAEAAGFNAKIIFGSSKGLSHKFAMAIILAGST